MSKRHVITLALVCFAFGLAVTFVVFALIAGSGHAGLVGLSVGGIGLALGVGRHGDDRTRDDRPSSDDSGRISDAVKRHSELVAEIEDSRAEVGIVTTGLDRASEQAGSAADRIKARIAERQDTAKP
jgi:hypothetical protein